jgi:hypothetical protein
VKYSVFVALIANAFAYPFQKFDKDGDKLYWSSHVSLFETPKYGISDHLLALEPSLVYTIAE